MTARSYVSVTAHGHTVPITHETRGEDGPMWWVGDKGFPNIPDALFEAFAVAVERECERQGVRS